MYIFWAPQGSEIIFYDQDKLGIDITIYVRWIASTQFDPIKFILRYKKMIKLTCSEISFCTLHAYLSQFTKCVAVYISSGLEIIFSDITQLSHGRSAVINCIDNPADSE